MQQFSYFCNTKIEMGMGLSDRLPELLAAQSVGASLLLVADPGVAKAGLIAPMQSALEAAGYRVVRFEAFSQNPRDAECLAGAKLFAEERLDAVVAIGGGSAMDTGKAIALLGPNGGEPLDYCEGRRAYAGIAPVVCVPTTAGTGSEVTRSSVITESSTHRKLTLKHAALRPQLAVLDPKLTFTVPPSVTAATGVDALVHAIEGYTCRATNPISQAMGARAMEIIVEALPIAYREPRNEEARFRMLEGSLLAGLCFGSSDVAAVHCLAEALGGLYDTPHGVANAVFLPYVLAFNSQEAKPVHAKLARIMKFAAESDADDVAVRRLVEGVRAWTAGLGIPKLGELPGVREEHFPRIVELAVQNNSTPSNVRPIGAENYARILKEAYGDTHTA